MTKLLVHRAAEFRSTLAVSLVSAPRNDRPGSIGTQVAQHISVADPTLPPILCPSFCPCFLSLGTRLPQKQPLLAGLELTAAQRQTAERINAAIAADFALRRRMLLRRCDVTVQSFLRDSSGGAQIEQEGQAGGTREGAEGGGSGGGGGGGKGEEFANLPPALRVRRVKALWKVCGRAVGVYHRMLQEWISSTEDLWRALHRASNEKASMIVDRKPQHPPNIKLRIVKNRAWFESACAQRLCVRAQTPKWVRVSRRRSARPCRTRRVKSRWMVP